MTATLHPIFEHILAAFMPRDLPVITPLPDHVRNVRIDGMRLVLHMTEAMPPDDVIGETEWTAKQAHKLRVGNGLEMKA